MKIKILGRVILLLFLVILVVVVANKDKVKTAFMIVEDLKRNDEFKKIANRITSIEPGMTREQVKKIMGEPIEIYFSQEKDKQLEGWIFDHPKLSSEPPRCLFDKEKGHVIKVIIGE